jgi:hypothetical protein
VGGPIQANCTAPSVPADQQPPGLGTAGAMIASILPEQTTVVGSRAAVACSDIKMSFAQYIGTNLVIFDGEGSGTNPGQLCTGLGGLPTGVKVAQGQSPTLTGDPKLYPGFYTCQYTDSATGARIFYSKFEQCMVGSNLTSEALASFNPASFPSTKVCTLPEGSGGGMGYLGANAIVYAASSGGADIACTQFQATSTAITPNQAPE